MLEILEEKLRGLTRRRKAVEFFLIFAVSFVLCGVGFYGEIAPLGLCFQGCFAGRRRMFFSFLGVVIGSCVWGYSPVKYIAVSLIVIVINEAFMHLADIKSYLYSAVIVTGTMGLIGLISLISPDSDSAGLLYLAELIICGMLSVLLFGAGGGKCVMEKEGGRAVSKILVAALCASVIPKIYIGSGGFSFGHVIVSALSFASALKFGLFGGVIVGLVGGLTLDLSGSGIPVCSFSLALGGVCAGAAMGKNRILRAVLFLVLGAGARFLSFGSSDFFFGLAELVLGVFSVSFLPSRFFEGQDPSEKDTDSDFCLDNSKKQISELLLGISDAYEQMAEVYCDGTDRVFPQKLGLGLYESACGEVCSSCDNKKICFEDKAEQTKACLERALPTVNARGNAEISDFGEGFSCVKGEEFCLAVTNQLRRHRQLLISDGNRREEDARIERQYRSISEMLEESAEAFVNGTVYDRDSGAVVKKIFDNYGVDSKVCLYRDQRGVLHLEVSGKDVSALLDHAQLLTEAVNTTLGCTLELPTQTEGKDYSCISFMERAEHDFSVGAIAEKRSGETVSGDCATYFRDREGNMYVVLCDGMGSGEEAHRKAGEIMHLCESFLRIGVSPVSTAEIVASTLEQQDRGAGGVTFDIARIDPYTSELISVKYGAAPTYIRHRTADGRYSLTKICAGGAGGELYGIARAQTELRDGDTVLMASDGAENGTRLEKSLVGVMTDDPSDLCEILMHMLPRDAADDRTLIAVNFYRRANKNARKARIGQA